MINYMIVIYVIYNVHFHHLFLYILLIRVDRETLGSWSTRLKQNFPSQVLKACYKHAGLVIYKNETDSKIEAEG